MVIFRVSENINIKTTDGTLVKYIKLKNPSTLFNETIYLTTYNDFKDLKKVFTNVGEKYKTRVIDETKIRTLDQFPKELGIPNINEYLITQNNDFKFKDFIKVNKKESELNSMYLNENKVDIKNQIVNFNKPEVSLVIIGNLGNNIAEMICACSALRILHQNLIKKFNSIKIDLYLNSSDNKFYTRDKLIFKNQSFINKVSALGINVKEFCEYDFFIDGSSVSNRSYYKNLPSIDGWLYKFGIDYKHIPDIEKYNTINLTSYKPKKSLEEKIKNLKLKGKILLYHPYSANINKSIPKEIAIKLLKELIIKVSNYTIVSVLKLDVNISDDRYVDLSNESKSFLDYSYIISNMDKIITTNTSTYHIADAFLIPTIVIFSNEEFINMAQIYQTSNILLIKDKSKNYSNFIFKNDSLILYKFDGWQKLKLSKIIKLLETI
ncbi:MAG: hypothetical protein GY932_00980 [Arcobacter sp.]|nr:hypothetical protein [Arcobacter sp.]